MTTFVDETRRAQRSRPASQPDQRRRKRGRAAGRSTQRTGGSAGDAQRRAVDDPRQAQPTGSSSTPLGKWEICATSLVRGIDTESILGHDLDAYRAEVRQTRLLNRENSAVSQHIRECGYALGRSDVPVMIHPEDGKSFFAAVKTCGSVWACACCSGKIAAQRADHIHDAAVQHLERGGQLFFMTLTMSHHFGESLEKLWKGLGKAWSRAFTRNPAWTDIDRGGDRYYLGVYGMTRVTEVTVSDPQVRGGHGWHTHYHVLMWVGKDFFDRLREKYPVISPDGFSLDEKSLDHLSLQRWQQVLLGRWQKALDTVGGFTANRHGLDIQLIGGDDVDQKIADYLTKSTYTPEQGISLEMTMAQSKGRSGNLKPFDLIKRCINDPEYETSPEWALWQEYCRAAKGKRQMIWSQKYKNPTSEQQKAWNKILIDRGRDAEMSDEELAAKTARGEKIIMIDGRDYNRHIMPSPYLAVEILRLAEARDIDQLISVLDDYGIRWWYPPDKPET